MGVDPTVLMPYQKYVEAYVRKPINGRKLLRGVFKEKNGKRITEELSCFVISSKAFECYKAAVDYFNYTLQRGELPRKALEAEWIKERTEIILDEEHY